MKKLLIIVLVFILCTGCQSSLDDNAETSQTPSTEENHAQNSSGNNQLLENIDNIKLLDKLEGHSSKLWTIDTSSENTFATGGQDGKVILWDADSLEKIYEVNSHNRLVEELFFLANGDILSISDDNTLMKLSAATGETELLYRGLTKEFNVSKDETLIAISNGNDGAFIFNFDSFTEIQKIKWTDGCFDIRFSNDNKYLYCVGHNGKVQKWNAATGELDKEFEGISSDVHCLEITNDDKYIVAGSIDRKVCVWNTETGEKISHYMHGDGLYDLDISEDGNIIASVGVDRQIIIAELETGKILKRLRHTDEIHAVAIDPGGNYIVAGGYDSVVYVWGFLHFDMHELQVITVENANDITLIGELKDHKGWVFDVDISHDDTLAASCERGSVNKVNIWDISSQTVSQSFELDQAIIEFEFSHDDRYLVCRGEMGRLIIWDIIKQEITYDSSTYSEEVFSFDISSDDKNIVTGSRNGEIKVRDFGSMELIRKAAFDDEFIMQAVFSPDDSKIAFSYAGSTKDFSAHVLDSNSLVEIYSTEGHDGYNYTVAFSKNSGILASCSGDDLIKLWNADTGEHIITLEGHTGKVMDVDFFLGDDAVVTGSAHDRSIRIWDISSGEILWRNMPGGEVQSVEMSSDGKFFISAGEDGNISIWGVENEGD